MENLRAAAEGLGLRQPPPVEPDEKNLELFEKYLTKHLP